MKLIEMKKPKRQKTGQIDATSRVLGISIYKSMMQYIFDVSQKCLQTVQIHLKCGNAVPKDG